ncbi:hypothetical protein BBMN23_1609 [Bifidobacterium adolescentis]|uniref:Uncharacterized protein n=1 Tax=Bifidobacterium adolescentis L2-32 TaxID=411481 RepID=A7A762_BIFAD|nr:hypothetical protein BBMN23_1609 [Bifidobacterium adolescentis]EDN82644.1 hypothetical protein BIFADO_01697 [Bifidobacterium adolescentis L2-32]
MRHFEVSLQTKSKIFYPKVGKRTAHLCACTQNHRQVRQQSP